MAIASFKIFFFLIISCNVCHELYPFYLSEAASVHSTGTTASRGKGGISPGIIVAIVVSICVAVLIFIVGICRLIKRKRKKYDSEFAIGVGNRDSLQYDFRTIQAATNNFSAVNRLGQGAFGVVYKGMLPNGQAIAVKRLSKISRQGVEEFKNEIEVLARLQHKNLVTFLGFCVQKEEKILLFEYMPNRSVRDILFDLKKQRQLVWTKLHKIIKGIACGIQYLHDDSTLRIIHRNLKLSDVLLDDDMNPKLADFGLSIIFKVDQTQENTDRITGTSGYMAPEYIMQGHISTMSDVFSFGVILMEIISRRSVNSLEEHEEDIYNYAWRLWKDGKPLELLNPSIRESCNPNEAVRCIHISLLCIQEDPALRPSMSSILLMLESYTLTLPTPSQPAFFKEEEDNHYYKIYKSRP